MKSCDSKVTKKTYHPPRLLVYGDLRTLTQMVKGGPDPDNLVKMQMGKS